MSPIKSPPLTRRDAIRTLSGLVLAGTAPGVPKDASSFWVLGLFKPKFLRVLPSAYSRLHCSGPSGIRVVEGGDSLSVDVGSAPLRITGFEGEPVACIIEIPGVIRRSYFGTFEIRVSRDILIPVVFMQREIAVASIVGAELPVSSARLPAMAAQAVIARSFIAATSAPRHSEADFCDTTHCQFLRSPAVSGSLVAEATRQTRDSALVCAERLIPGLYSAACGGHTDSHDEGGYVYRSVACEICERAKFARRGHGLGLCQEGSMGLARAGWTWREILRKYYPGSSVQGLA